MIIEAEAGFYFLLHSVDPRQAAIVISRQAVGQEETMEDEKRCYTRSGTHS